MLRRGATPLVAVLAVLVALVVAACGGGASTTTVVSTRTVGPASAAGGTATGRSAAVPRPNAGVRASAATPAAIDRRTRLWTGLDPDGRRAGRAVLAYTDAVSDRDLDRACAALTDDLRRRAARSSGTCAENLRANTGPGLAPAFRALVVRYVRVRGSRARVYLARYGGRGSARVTVLAVRGPAGWRSTAGGTIQAALPGLVTLRDYAAVHERACRQTVSAVTTYRRRLRVARKRFRASEASGIGTFRRTGLGAVSDLRTAARTFANAVPARGYEGYQRRLRREFRRVGSYIDREERLFRGVRTLADVDALPRRLGRYPRGGSDPRVPDAILARAPTCRSLFGSGGRPSGGGGRLV